jgi:uncharacterized protein YacL
MGKVDIHKPKLQSRAVMSSVFILGLLAAIALRAIIVANHINPLWIRPLWYFAVLGNFVFFYFRFRIAQKRKKAIKDFMLVERISEESSMDEDSKEVTLYLLSSISKSPENLNYLILFIFSLLAIALDILFISLG